MKKLLYICAGLLFAGGIASCRHNEENALTQQAVALFERSRYITRKYIDSLGIARDSVTVLRLSKNLEDEITRINYSFPSDTYLAMSEGANDTLTRLTVSFARQRDSLLRRFSEVPVEADSTVRADSLSVAINKNQ